MVDKNIRQKLLLIQSQLKAPKNQYNSFGKYNYRSCEDILEGLKPLLKEVGAVVMLSDEIVLVGDRFYLKATATLVDEKTGDSISTTAFAREDETKKGMDLAQVTGSVSSYARKYALNGLFCIDDTKDSDSTNQHGKEEKQTQQQTPPKKNDPLALVKTYADKAGMNNAQVGELIKAKYEGKSFKDLNTNEKNELIEHLRELAGA